MPAADYTNSADFVMSDKLSASGLNINVENDERTLQCDIIKEQQQHPNKSLACKNFLYFLAWNAYDNTYDIDLLKFFL